MTDLSTTARTTETEDVFVEVYEYILECGRKRRERESGDEDEPET